MCLFKERQTLALIVFKLLNIQNYAGENVSETTLKLLFKKNPINKFVGENYFFKFAAAGTSTLLKRFSIRSVFVDVPVKEG